MKRGLRAPSPAMIVALVALVLALAGTGYAALQIPSNSVGSKQLKSGSVTAAKLHGGAVTTGKLRNHAVTGPKLNLKGVVVPNAVHAGVADSAPLPLTLPSRRTLTGEWDAAGYSTVAGTTAVSAQSFAIPLKAAPHVVLPGIQANPACPGNFAHPAAKPGNLCLYTGNGSNVDSITTVTSSGTPGADAFGFIVEVRDDQAAQSFFGSGSWAVTAP